MKRSILITLLILISCEKPQTEAPIAIKTSKAIERGRIAEVIDSSLEPPSLKADCDSPIETLRAPASTSQKEKSGQCNHDLYHDRSVVYIGDSHSYLRSSKGSRMGNKVVDLLKSCGASAISYHGVCGSRPRNWMPGSTPKSTCGVSKIDANGFKTSNKGSSKNIAQLQASHSPEIVIINLGDNMFSWKKQRGKTVAHIPSSQKVANEVKALIDSLDQKTQCQWIGPVYHSPGKPYVKTNASVDKLYEAIVAGLGNRCHLIDSRGFFTSTRANDGLHLTQSESKTWGDKLSESLKNIH